MCVGLEVILHVGQEEYAYNIGDVAGALMVVHSQDAMPFPEDEGIMLYPGENAAVGLRKVENLLTETISNHSQSHIEESILYVI